MYCNACIVIDGDTLKSALASCEDSQQDASYGGVFSPEWDG